MLVQAHYYRPLVEYVRAIKEDRDVVLTGHSLGGGLARIVGALEKWVERFCSLFIYFVLLRRDSCRACYDTVAL